MCLCRDEAIISIKYMWFRYAIGLVLADLIWYE